MNKKQAISRFGSGVKLGKAMGITKQAVSQLPDKLTQKYVDWIIGASLRLGVDVSDLPHNISDGELK